MECPWLIALNTKHCVLSVAGNGNANGNNNDNSIIVLFLLPETQNYVFVVVLPSRDNQKFSKLLCKGFERSVYCNEHKTKSDNKNTTKELDFFFLLLEWIDYLL